jgi:hypothetical protein
VLSLSIKNFCPCISCIDESASGEADKGPLSYAMIVRHHLAIGVWKCFQELRCNLKLDIGVRSVAAVLPTIQHDIVRYVLNEFLFIDDDRSIEPRLIGRIACSTLG